MALSTFPNTVCFAFYFTIPYKHFLNSHILVIFLFAHDNDLCIIPTIAFHKKVPFQRAPFEATRKINVD